MIPARAKNKGEGSLAKANAESVSLETALARMTEALAANLQVDPQVIRELVVRCEIHKDEIWPIFLEHEQSWPEWTRYAVMSGMITGIARVTGDHRPFHELYLASHSKKPEGDELPLAAWIVFLTWLNERGQDQSIPLPDWVNDYFQQAAVEILAIRHADDLRGEQQISAVARALRFVRRGANVFATDDTRFKEDAAAIKYYHGCEPGLTGEQRIEAVCKLIDVDDTRTTRRYVARGKRRQSRP